MGKGKSWDDESLPGRDIAFSYIAGAMFAIGWWFWIDAAAYSSHEGLDTNVVWWTYIPGFISTIGLILINITSIAAVNSDYDDEGVTGARVCFFISIVVAFVGVVLACWIGILRWISDGDDSWPGVALILQNVFILFAGLIYHNAKSNNDDY